MKIIQKRGVLEAISMVFGGFWGDPPVILQVNPPPSKRVVILKGSFWALGPQGP